MNPRLTSVAKLGRLTGLCAATVVTSSVACTHHPLEIRESDARGITAAVVSQFLGTVAGRWWPAVYVSDEHLPFEVDSAWIASLGFPSITIRGGRQEEVTVDYGVVRGGGLLLVPSSPLSGTDGGAQQGLWFTSSPDFGGRLEYWLSRSIDGRWRVTRVTIRWIA